MKTRHTYKNRFCFHFPYKTAGPSHDFRSWINKSSNFYRLARQWLRYATVTKDVKTSSDYAVSSLTNYDTIRYDTIEEINVDSKAEYTA